MEVESRGVKRSCNDAGMPERAQESATAIKVDARLPTVCNPSAYGARGDGVEAPSVGNDDREKSKAGFAQLVKATCTSR